MCTAGTESEIRLSYKAHDMQAFIEQQPLSGCR